MSNRVCSIEGCGQAHIARGWCHRHYKRWQTFGAPTGVGEDRGQYGTGMASRFWPKVLKTETCWLWTGADSGEGYGRLRGEDGRTVAAHRVSWVLAGKTFTPGLELDHLCGVPECVNPEHLEEVTHAINTARSTGPTARNGRKTHCDHGHPLSGENLYQPTPNARQCRTCYLASQRRYKAKRKIAIDT